MKAIYKHIAFAALALSAVACSQDDDFAPSYLSDPDAVRITAQVGTADVTGGFTRSNPLGTAEEQAKFNTGDQISVTAGTQAPVTYQLDADGWKPVGETYLKWQTNEMNVTAYYPVGKNDASATTFTVPQTYADLAAIAEADYMTYNGTQTKGDDKSINLEMQRKMVRLVITPKLNDQFATGYSVTTIKVHANTKGYADGQPETGDITVTALKQGDNFYALLAPTTEATAATFLTVTVSDGTTSQDLTVKDIPATTAGNSYSFTLTVGKDMVKMGTVSVNPWTGATIVGGVAEEVKVETVIEGSTATITVPELATDAMVQNAVTEALADNATLLMINGQLTDAQQTAIATALTEKTDVALVMSGVSAPATAITELTGIDLAYKNGTGENAYAVASDGTHIITGKDGLDAWNTAATSDVSTNLTLACDIEYNANWSRLEVTYNGTINGNGYAIIGLNCSASNSAGFIYNLGGEGVIKYLGIVGGSFSNSESTIGCGSRAFVSDNYGVIMGCYNTSSCTSAGGREDFGNAAGFSTYNETTGKIIACYNTGTISAGGSYGSGISCYNKGVISSCYNTGAVSGKGESLGYYASAITSANRKTINDCYYTQPSRGYETDPSDPSYSNTATATNIAEVSSSDWTAAMNAMNAAIEAYNADEANTVKCNYRYAINTDAATKSAQPLVIVEAPATE